MSRAKSSKQPVASTAHAHPLLQHFDWLIVVALLILTAVMIQFGGLRRGLELMPWPDGLEYAASAVNLAAGRGAVLHFGGYTYPSRYTGGYPLILEFFRRVFGGNVSLLSNASAVIAILSVLAVFFLARMVYGRL